MKKGVWKSTQRNAVNDGFSPENMAIFSSEKVRTILSRPDGSHDLSSNSGQILVPFQDSKSYKIHYPFDITDCGDHEMILRIIETLDRIEVHYTQKHPRRAKSTYLKFKNLKEKSNKLNKSGLESFRTFISDRMNFDDAINAAYGLQEI